MLEVGRLYRYEGRIWRAGLVNTSRARLDPVTGVVGTSPVSGKKPFMTYGTSVNVSPNSTIETVEEEDLNDAELRRLVRLEQEATMAVAGPPVGATTGTKDKTLKEKNQERRAALDEKKEKARQERREQAAANKAAKAEKKQQPCKCGCGQLTGGYFYPGHDARFKGWLLKIERGQAKPEELLTPEVRGSYKWRKTADGKGLIPTTNYKGEPHSGYDTASE